MSFSIGWLNNSGNPCGGTLQATNDMILALPDCQHTVYLPGNADRRAHELIGKKAEIKYAQPVGKHDLIICHNTPRQHIPTKGLVIYYLHSMAGVKDFKGPRLTVSNWLAAKAGWDPSTVLYQPVSRPALHPQREAGKVTVGRICTPSDRKWRLPEWLPHMQALQAAVPGVEIHLVGCPVTLQDRVGSVLTNCVTHLPSPASKALIARWDVLLYTSGIEESFGRVVREAQRVGTYPVVSNKGGFIEQVQQAGGTLVDTPEDVVKAFTEGPVFGATEREEMIQKADAVGSYQAWREGFLKKLGEWL